MKKILFGLLALLTMACGKDKYDYGTETAGFGTLNLSELRTGLSVTIEEATRAVNTDNYILRIYNTATDTLVTTFHYANMPEVLTLAVGSYRIEAASHDLQPVEWERPYYYASQDFNISKSQVTNITALTCTLHSIKVTVEYATVLTEALTGESTVEVSLGEALLNFNTTETRAAYFAAPEETNTIVVYFKAEIDGDETIFRRSFTDVKPGEHRVIRFSLKNNGINNVELGSLSFSLKQELDCQVVNITDRLSFAETVIDTPKQPADTTTTDAIAITGQDFDISQSLTITESVTSVIINIAAEAGIAGLTVDIDSETLTSDVLSDVGLSSHLDLVNPGSLHDAIAGLGFPVENQVVGQTSLKFDISQFVPLLGIYGAATHHFILHVSDANRNEKTETLTLISL